MNIKEYFKDEELECRCGCGKMPVTEAVEVLYALRVMLHKPIIITSAARCEQHNKNVGGKPDSYHLHGLAFDCVVDSGDRWYLIRTAMAMGFHGIGVSDKFIHIDLREFDKRCIWTYE